MHGVTLADELREIRHRAGISQSAMAAALQLPFRTYQSWEEGARKPSSYTAEAILNRAKALEYLGKLKGE